MRAQKNKKHISDLCLHRSEICFYADFDAVTANPIIINFLEQNPEEENAFLRKNESGQLELVRENGEIVETF